MRKEHTAVRRSVGRRAFLAASASGVAVNALRAAETAQRADPVRVGIVGTGGRGRSLLRILLGLGGVEIPALCDVNRQHLDLAAGMITKAGRAKPEGYAKDEYAFRQLLDRDDLDAVIIATPWEWHTTMAVHGMKARKYVGVEVPAAITLEECWELVTVNEETGVPCMMLENWSFRRDNLAVLNMIRRGLLGETMHCHCSYSHDCMGFFFDREGNPRWPGRHRIKRNADQYPTHALGPVISWMGITRGDQYASLTSVATKSAGINAYFTRKLGPEHLAARRTYAQGDVVTTVIKTRRGKTIVVNNDMQLPRPYDNRWTIQGTGGIYNEQRAAVYIEGRSPRSHQWEPFEPYQKEFDHAWWRSLGEKEARLGHGGTDTLELMKFLEAVRKKGPTPIDVYESVAMSVIVALSERSIQAGSAPVPCPDFTRGAWKTRKPSFAIEA
jgi:predicted dehydrogenase